MKKKSKKPIKKLRETRKKNGWKKEKTNEKSEVNVVWGIIRKSKKKRKKTCMKK